MEGLRYLLLSLAFGLVATWASENMFWIVPPPGASALDLAFTWGAYSLATAGALSAVILTRAGGLAGAFLGGAILGYLVEGVIVGTIYEAFPLQLVWTPLAWHGLVTGAVVIGLGRAPMAPPVRAGFWLAVGLAATVWALYWPLERAVLPDTPTLFIYLALPAGMVALAEGLIDRLGGPPAPKAWVLWLAPLLLAGLWLAQFVAAPDPLRLSIFPVLALVIRAMRRGARGGDWGRPRPLWQHGLVIIAPLTVAVLAPPLWAAFGAIETNVPIAVATGLFALAWLTRLAIGRTGRPRARPPIAGSPPSVTT